jgi:protein-S-isoprenylcysteine O-methyltransferase Ste14
MESSIPLHPLMRIPPPLLFVATFLAGVGLQHLDPLIVLPASYIAIAHLVGAALLVAGVTVVLFCIRLFVKSRTTLIPFETATTLVMRGPYRLTRNPMYLSLVVVYLGAVALLMQFWSLLLLPVPVMIVNGIVIPTEESRLREKFGESFLAYCARVRRWL